MPRNFLQRTFHDWRAKNRSLFQRKVIGVHYQRGSISFRLTHSKELVVYINHQGAGVAYVENGETLDLLVCFDMLEQRGSDGLYRCGWCVMHDPTQAIAYESREALWEKEVFEPLMEWINSSDQSALKS